MANNEKPRLFPGGPHLPDGATVLTTIFTSAWVGAYVLEIFLPDFQAPSSLDPLMLIVAGAYFTNRALTQKKEDKPNDE